MFEPLSYRQTLRAASRGSLVLWFVKRMPACRQCFPAGPGFLGVFPWVNGSANKQLAAKGQVRLGSLTLHPQFISGFFAVLSLSLSFSLSLSLSYS
jgi:hypothetical protein